MATILCPRCDFFPAILTNEGQLCLDCNAEREAARALYCEECGHLNAVCTCPPYYAAFDDDTGSFNASERGIGQCTGCGATVQGPSGPSCNRCEPLSAGVCPDCVQEYSYCECAAQELGIVWPLPICAYCSTTNLRTDSVFCSETCAVASVDVEDRPFSLAA